MTDWRRTPDVHKQVGLEKIPGMDSSNETACQVWGWLALQALNRWGREVAAAQESHYFFLDPSGSPTLGAHYGFLK